VLLRWAPGAHLAHFIPSSGLVDPRLPPGVDKDKVKNSPSVDVNKPVSRQHELDWFGYYGYPATGATRTVGHGYYRAACDRQVE